MKRGITGRAVEVTTVGASGSRRSAATPLRPGPRVDLAGPLEPLLVAGAVLARSAGSTACPPCCRTRRSSSTPTCAKEAVLSSQIEGTQSSLSDLLLFELDEAPGVPLDDVVEVSNYVAALEHGLARLREGFRCRTG